MEEIFNQNPLIISITVIICVALIAFIMSRKGNTKIVLKLFKIFSIEGESSNQNDSEVVLSDNSDETEIKSIKNDINCRDGLSIALDNLHGRYITRKDSLLINSFAIQEAEKEVRSISGDLSWALDLLDEIKKRSEEGVIFNILCKDPVAEYNKEIVRELRDIRGVHIKYFHQNCDPMIRGIIIDPSTFNRSFFFSKKKDKSEDKREITRFSSGDMNRMQFAINLLFDQLWSNSSESNILVQYDDEKLQYKLGSIVQYENAEISIEKILISNIYPLHKHINKSRLASIQLLIERQRKHGLECCDSIVIHSTDATKVIPPPIVEVHDNKHILIDGAHRTYWLKEEGEVSEIKCILIKNASTKPAGDIRSWEDVYLGNQDGIDREKNFLNYNPKNWRDLSKFFNEI